MNVGGLSHRSAARRRSRLHDRHFGGGRGTRSSKKPLRALSAAQEIQKVGFRAMIQKHAIMYDLAGSARNIPDGTVSINLQGDKDRIDKALEAIRAGSKRSSRQATRSP